MHKVGVGNGNLLLRKLIEENYRAGVSAQVSGEDCGLRIWLNTLLRLAWGTYFVLTSLYCILAFLPYTFCAFIKAPPYPWLPWFVHHQAGLYWTASVAAIASNWRWKESWRRRDKVFLTGFGAMAAVGLYLTLCPFLPGLESNRTAYGWSLAALLALSGLSLWRSVSAEENDGLSPVPETAGKGVIAYSGGLLIAIVVSVIYVGGARVREYSETRMLGLHSADIELAIWSIVSHCCVAIAIVSALNLIHLLTARMRRRGAVRLGLTGALIVVGLCSVLVHFLGSALSFDGWAALVYAASFSIALTLWGFSLALPLLRRRRSKAMDNMVARKLFSWRTLGTWIAITVLAALALASRSLIGGEDWNGFIGNTWALVFWAAMSLCIVRLRPVRAQYSWTVVLAVLLVSTFVYKGLQATEIFWGKPLGATDDEISRAFEAYEQRDASFELAHHVLGNGRAQNCGDLCRILREHTNIRDTHIRTGVDLAGVLTKTKEETPNIFIFVIDSMRPDYLGAYNPAGVDYTPNLDALARDSVVFKNAYTHYVGTSLSEPAIWSGSLLLHTHLPQPFDKVNSLQAMARVDGYQTVVSYDTVLRQMFPPSENLIKLDTNKEMWNQFEACSTVQQLESELDGRQDKSRSVLFYAQPMNVHQFAHNDMPSPASQHWRSRPGMNSRITYEVHWVDSCLGEFFTYLKQRGMYDDSIIVIASDHGDATGEFGRISHSTSIWPEIMRVPLIIHVPTKMREGLVYDDTRPSTLTDIAPTLYYLLGHRPIRVNPLYGRPLFARNRQELDAYPKQDLLIASDVRAVYGILTADGRYLYTTYDSPEQSYLFDLQRDPNAERSVLTPDLKQHYDKEIIEHLQLIADYYGYKPGIGSLLASARR